VKRVIRATLYNVNRLFAKMSFFFIEAKIDSKTAWKSGDG